MFLITLYSGTCADPEKKSRGGEVRGIFKFFGGGLFEAYFPKCFYVNLKKKIIFGWGGGLDGPPPPLDPRIVGQSLKSMGNAR